MQTQIVARVAEYIRNPEVRKSPERSASAQAPTDKVVLSSEGRKKYDELSKVDSSWEKERLERVDHIAEQVRMKSYRMSPDMVDQIAQKIVALL